MKPVDRRLGMLSAILFLGGCGQQSSATDSPAAREAAVARDSVGQPAVICLPTGLWQHCSVVKRLEMAGLAPRVEAETVREGALTASGRRYALGSASLLVFLYPDERARLADESRLDTVAYIDAYRPLSMRQEVTRIGAANLLAILRSPSDRQRARVADVLTAGPPQPEQSVP